MKPGDLVIFDADIVKRIFPTGLFDGDMGTIISECNINELAKMGRTQTPFPHLDTDTPIWWVQWWTGDYAGRKIYCEEKYLRIIGEEYNGVTPQ